MPSPGQDSEISTARRQLSEALMVLQITVQEFGRGEVDLAELDRCRLDVSGLEFQLSELVELDTSVPTQRIR